MDEKRYYAHKHLLQEKVHDKICHNFMGLDETVEHMNNQYWKYKQLKEENEQLKLDKQQIDKKIKELSTTTKYGDIHEDLRIFAQQVLYDLKKELSDK